MSAINYINKLNKQQLSLASLVGIGLASLALVCSVLLIWYYSFCQSHLPPNVTIENIDVGGLTYPAAEQILQETLDPPPAHTLVLSVDDISIASPSAELGVFYDFKKPLAEIEQKTSSGSLLQQATKLIGCLTKETKLSAPLNYDDHQLNNIIELLNQEVSYEGTTPSASLSVSGSADSIVIDPGSRGREINTSETKTRVLSELRSGGNAVEAVVASTSSVLSEEQIALAKDRATNFVGKQLVFSFENVSYYLSDQMLVDLMTLPDGVNQQKLATLIETWGEKLNRSPQEPEFVYDPETLVVSTFVPPKDGRTLDVEKTQQQVLTAIANIEQATTTDTADDLYQHQLAVETTPPNTSLADTNDLGIKELIGFGDSHYDHSIPNRIHNVKLTTDRISLTIVPPGEEFRFNNTLGPVSTETGYRSAYVIRNGQTELGDGGGVCQVSTTLFRAVLNAGLDVTLRLPHSYRVSYYELDQKPGVDATVYAGNTDFRFINDTDHHILIYGEADSNSLYMYFDIYGTSDGRTAEIINHKTWGYKPPLEPVYIDDPSLAPGQIKQVDWAAAGISASFTNVVKDKFGNIMYEDTYTSHYQPWAAKYLRGV